MPKSTGVYLNKEQRNKLYKIERKAKVKKYLIAMAGISIFLAFCSIFIFVAIPQKVHDKQNITGKTVKITGTPTKHGTNTAMIVELENGKNIRLGIPETMTYKPNAKVNIKAYKTSSGAQMYQLINYAQ